MRICLLWKRGHELSKEWSWCFTFNWIKLSRSSLKHWFLQLLVPKLITKPLGWRHRGAWRLPSSNLAFKIICGYASSLYQTSFRFSCGGDQKRSPPWERSEQRNEFRHCFAQSYQRKQYWRFQHITVRREK